MQNQYGLLMRTFESDGLAEACSPINFDVALLPWTPLGGGILTQKYLNEDQTRVMSKDEWEAKLPPSRYTSYAAFMNRYHSSRSLDAVNEYAQIAKRYGMTLTTLALRFCHSRVFSTSPIIGCTTIAQLKEDCAVFIEGESNVLPEQCDKDIDDVHTRIQNPILNGM